MGLSSSLCISNKTAPIAFVNTSQASINGCKENQNKLIRVLYPKFFLILQKLLGVLLAM